MNEDINIGNLTNKGIVKMVDNPWKDKDGNDVDRIVLTHKGAFRYSELEKIEKTEKPKIELKDLIDFNSVMGIDIRPGQVTSAERVKKTDKLLHLKVKMHLGTKDVITNIGDMFEPIDLIGKKMLFVWNMPPVKMKGVISEGMIIPASIQKFNPDENIYEPKTVLMEVSVPLDSKTL